MEWLLALLAFAGVMAFLSTLVSVFVEGLHKVFGLRRAGLEEMLRAMHRSVLTRLDPRTARLDTTAVRDPAESRQAARFAKGMTESVAFDGYGRPWWLRNIPILNWFFQRRHEKLSTLQFVEQLARSDVGTGLRELPRGDRANALTAAAYEFERYGDAQSSYFQSRARILSVFFAMAFAFAANIDALEIYRQIRADAAIRNTFASLDVDALERSAAAAAQRERNLGELQTQTAQGIGDLRAYGLSIGYTAFPFCVSPESPPRDRRCRGQASHSVDVPAAFGRFVTSGAGWLWLLSVIAAGGLIGLGAPFWYQVFRRLARIAPAPQSVRAVLQPDAAPTPLPARRGDAVRDPNAVAPNALLLAFDVASGSVADSIVTHDRPSLVVRGDGSVAPQGPLSRHLR